MNIGPYRDLIDLLSSRTSGEWCHHFNTTNWDYLLQREISLNTSQQKPRWLLNSHVFHLNGSVEDWGDASKRSEILLESDSASQRTWSIEASKSFNTLIHQRLVIVVGMSFTCATDRFF